MGLRKTPLAKELTVQGMKPGRFIMTRVQPKVLKTDSTKADFITLGLKFTLTEKGEVQDIESYISTSNLAYEQIKTALQSSSGLWSLGGKGVRRNYTIILPLIFSNADKDTDRLEQKMKEVLAESPHLLYYPKCKDSTGCLVFEPESVYLYDAVR